MPESPACIDFSSEQANKKKLSTTENLSHSNEVLPYIKKYFGPFKFNVKVIMERAVDLHVHLHLPTCTCTCTCVKGINLMLKSSEETITPIKTSTCMCACTGKCNEKCFVAKEELPQHLRTSPRKVIKPPERFQAGFSPNLNHHSKQKQLIKEPKSQTTSLMGTSDCSSTESMPVSKSSCNSVINSTNNRLNSPPSSKEASCLLPSEATTKVSKHKKSKNKRSFPPDTSLESSSKRSPSKTVFKLPTFSKGFINSPTITPKEFKSESPSVQLKRKRQTKTQKLHDMISNIAAHHEEIATIEAMEKDMIKIDEVDTNCVSQKKLFFEPEFFEENKIALNPPGLEIFSCKNYCSYLNTMTDAMLIARFFEDFNDDFQVMLEINEPRILTMIEHNILVTDSKYPVKNRLDLLFRIMMIHEAITVSQMCFNTILKIFNHHQTKLKWIPSVNNVALHLINYGANVNALCPIKTIMESVEKLLKDGMCCPSGHKVLYEGKKEACENLDYAALEHVCHNPENHKEITHGLKLSLMLDVLLARSEMGNPTMYKTEDAASIVSLFYWIILDKKLISHITSYKMSHPVVGKVQKLCTIIIEKVALDKCPTFVEKVSNYFSLHNWHHHNMGYVMRNFPDSERGQLIKRISSYKVLLNYFGEDTTENMNEIRPKSLYNLLKNHPLYGFCNDKYFLCSLVSLYELCFDFKTKLTRENGLYMKKFASLLAFSNSKIQESLNCKDSSKVKLALVYLECKLIIFTQNRSSDSLDQILKEDIGDEIYANAEIFKQSVKMQNSLKSFVDKY